MAEFTYEPDFGAKKNAQPVVRQARFGDGYAQVARWGINNINESWPLSFSYRTQTEADAIESFFVTAAGVDTFDWTPPGASSPQKFRCTVWDREIAYAGIYNLTATFERCYEP